MQGRFQPRGGTGGGCGRGGRFHNFNSNAQSSHVIVLNTKVLSASNATRMDTL